ncbi:uncharacterized protein LOC123404431 [Hordeum vulgare subsp. vulgare]|uniref:Uncharacterized protein n=1 Tax=Hordeum vulgare subsp. vulgare TaxID=112509 RepID=A0A8I6YWW4_HORVV|nr:uncharacterized protein LOC123404431 [Hordeum vulgare subsp. vulgare]
MAMASRSTALLLLLAAALLLASSCHASPSPPHAISGGEGKKKAADVVPAETDPSKCEMMVPCSEEKCTEHCVRIGLGNARGFCSFHDLHFECCCPIPPPPRRLSSSGRRTGSV